MNLVARLALTALSAAIAIACFPPFHWPYLALVAWIPLIIALRGAGSRCAVVLGLLHGMALFAGTLVWLTEIFGPMALLLQFILAMFTAFFAALFNIFDKPEKPTWFQAPLAAMLWTGIEYYRCEWFTLRFPWITPGTGLPPNAFTSWIGVYGVSALIILATVWISSRSSKHRLTGLLTLLVLTSSTWFHGSWSREKTGLERRITAVQGETLGFEQYMDLSNQIEGLTSTIIWPEYALNFDLRKSPEKLNLIRKMMKTKGAEVFVVGSKTEHANGSWSNTAIIVGRDAILGSHDKNRPVHFFDDGEPGKEAPAWQTPIGAIATPICFDNDYSAVTREAVAKGAELLLIPSMDAEHWTARQHLQHAELFRHRAAENGRWVAVAASSGLTQVIDPSGKRVDSLPLFEPGVLSAMVRTQSRLTFYTQSGWLLGPVCAGIAAILTVIAVIRVRREGKTKRGPRND